MLASIVSVPIGTPKVIPVGSIGRPWAAALAMASR